MALARCMQTDTLWNKKWGFPRVTRRCGQSTTQCTEENHALIVYRSEGFDRYRYKIVNSLDSLVLDMLEHRGSFRCCAWSISGDLTMRCRERVRTCNIPCDTSAHFPRNQRHSVCSLFFGSRTDRSAPWKPGPRIGCTHGRLCHSTCCVYSCAQHSSCKTTHGCPRHPPSHRRGSRVEHTNSLRVSNQLPPEQPRHPASSRKTRLAWRSTSHRYAVPVQPGGGPCWCHRSMTPEGTAGHVVWKPHPKISVWPHDWHLGLESCIWLTKYQLHPPRTHPRGWKFTGSKAAWVGSVAAAEAKKAEGASKATLRIPKPPHLTGKFACIQLLLLLLLNSHLITRQLMKHPQRRVQFCCPRLISGTKFMMRSLIGMQQDISIFKQKGFKLFLERCQRYVWVTETVRQNVQSIPSNRSTITETSVRTNCFASYCHRTARKCHAAHLKAFHLSAYD